MSKSRELSKVWDQWGKLKRENGFMEMDIHHPDASGGNWSEYGPSDWIWGTPKFHNSFNTASYTNEIGAYRQWNIPTGMKSAFISHLEWSNGGYIDCYGVQDDGELVFLRRINTRQAVKLDNSGDNAGSHSQHDGATISFIGTGLEYFKAIRIVNKGGTFHFTGLAFSPNANEGFEGTGMVHPAQISLQGSGSGLDADKVDGKDLGQSGINYIPYANSSGNVLIGTTTDNGVDKLQVDGSALFAGNINAAKIYAENIPMPPNLIKNSFMTDLTDGKPTGYSYSGITIEAVHPFTKGFEGSYTPSKPTNAVDDPELATGSNPYWYGKYHKGPRIGKGGLGDGWCSINNGHILKITAQKTNDFRWWTTLWFPYNNILAATNKIGFRAYIKLVKGSVVGIGVDAGFVGEARGQIRITKEDCDNSPQGWYYIDEIADTYQVTLPFYNNFVIGFSKNEDIEAYLALPYAYIPMGSRPGTIN